MWRKIGSLLTLQVHVTLGNNTSQGHDVRGGVRLGVVCSSPPTFLNGGVILPHHDVARPQSFFTVLVVSLRCPHVCGEGHPSGLRGHGADDGVHLHGLVTVWLGVQVLLQGDSCPSRCHSWTIILSLRVFVLCDGVSPVTGKGDEIGFQAVPSSMPA